MWDDKTKRSELLDVRMKWILLKRSIEKEEEEEKTWRKKEETLGFLAFRLGVEKNMIAYVYVHEVQIKEKNKGYGKLLLNVVESFGSFFLSLSFFFSTNCLFFVVFFLTYSR